MNMKFDLIRPLTKKERIRVKSIIDTLYGRSISFGDACEELGFDVTELNSRELVEIDNSIIQCDVCGKWIKPHEGQINISLGRVCRKCNKAHIARVFKREIY